MSHSIVAPVFALLCTITAAGFCDDQPKISSAKKKDHTPRITSTVDVKQVSALSDHDANEISFAASRILKHVAQARTALHSKKMDEAKTHVDQGLKLIAIIDGLLPRYLVKTEIKSGEHVYSDEDQVAPEYVTIFSEVERRDIISPVLQAKREHAFSRQHQQAGKEHADQTGPAYAVSHEEIQYTAAKLNLAVAAHMLNHAKQALHEDKAPVADEALKAIQAKGVLFEYEETDLPLKEAADNLKLAEMEMKQGHHEHAKAALHVASDQLKLYEKKTGEKRSAEVKTLHHEIDKLTTQLEKGEIAEAEFQKHASTISGWWQRASKWFKTK